MRRTQLALAMDTVMHPVAGDVEHGKKSLGVVALVAAIAIPIAAPALVSSLATSGALGATMSAALTTTTGSVIGSALTSATLSAATAKLTGGDAREAALMGAISGGLSGYGFAQTDAFRSAQAVTDAATAGANISNVAMAGGTSAEIAAAMDAANAADAVVAANQAATAGTAVAQGTSAGLSNTSAPAGAAPQAGLSNTAAAPAATPQAGLNAAATTAKNVGVGQQIYNAVTPALQGSTAPALAAALDPNTKAAEDAAARLQADAEAARLRQEQQYTDQMAIAKELSSQAANFDPTNYAQLRANAAQITSARARDEALRGINPRDAQAAAGLQRRYDIEGAEASASAYDTGMLTGLQTKSGLLTTAMSVMPSVPGATSESLQAEADSRRKELEAQQAAAAKSMSYYSGTQSIG